MFSKTPEGYIPPVWHDLQDTVIDSIEKLIAVSIYSSLYFADMTKNRESCIDLAVG